VVVLNYCRALQPKFLARLVDHARYLHRLEIYGERREIRNGGILSPAPALALAVALPRFFLPGLDALA